MDAYLYKAALWCGPCIIKTLVAERKAAPGALDMEPADALQQIVSLNGFTSESDYDSDDLPKGPYADGGGEADTPQHCDGCGLFLETSLTTDGYRYVREKLIEHARDGSGNPEVLKQWAKHYGVSFVEPKSVTPGALELEYSMKDSDQWGTTMSWWFAVAAELFTRGEPIPEEWKYSPGALGKPVDLDDDRSLLVAGASTPTLLGFAENLAAEAEQLKANGQDY